MNEALQAEGVKGYLVGGFVRDKLLRRRTRDIDLAVAAPALPLAERLAPLLGARPVVLDARNGVARLVLSGGWHLDLATIQGDLERDLARRDFTIDAMAVPLGGDGFHDLFGGRQDLEQRLVRVVSPSVFQQDPVRLLRGIRLAAELDFSLEAETRRLMAQDAHLLATAPGERLREELMRLLSVPAAPWLVEMDRLGLLGVLFPELEACRGVGQPPEHHWDVLGHSLETVRAAEFLLRECDTCGEEVGGEVLLPVPWPAEAEAHFRRPIAGFPRSALFKLAGLLHDIAKPQTRAPDERGRLRFFGHPHLGAEMATAALRRLRFSNREIEMVARMVTHHLRPTQIGKDGLPTSRAVFRFIRDTGEVALEVLYLSLADHMATRGPGLIESNWREHCRLVEFILEEERRQREAVAKPFRLLTGHDIMAAFGLPPGPRIGRLLELVEEARAAGELATREQALALVGREIGA